MPFFIMLWQMYI